MAENAETEDISPENFLLYEILLEAGRCYFFKLWSVSEKGFLNK